MWGISWPNLAMMMFDSTASLLGPTETDTTPPVLNGRQTAGGRHTTPPMNFGTFLKTMHEIQDHRQ